MRLKSTLRRVFVAFFVSLHLNGFYTPHFFTYDKYNQRWFRIALKKWLRFPIYFFISFSHYNNGNRQNSKHAYTFLQ